MEKTAYREQLCVLILFESSAASISKTTHNVRMWLVTVSKLSLFVVGE